MISRRSITPRRIKYNSKSLDVCIYIYMYMASARQAEDLGPNPCECQFFYLFRCVLSSLLLLRIGGRSYFDKGLHNLIRLIKKRPKKVKLLYYIMESTVSCSLCIYIHIYIVIFLLIVHC